MKHYISDEAHYITLQDTAEFMLTRRLIAKERGQKDHLTQRLSKLVCAAVDIDRGVEADFFGDDCDSIVEALHYCAIDDKPSWSQAQASHMLAEAI